MKVIIAGGRYYKFQQADKDFLDEQWKKLPITEVVCGHAPGADTEGYDWAHEREIPIVSYPARWERWGVDGAVIGVRANGMKYNKLAGFWRNQEMADYADALIAFPGGTGTADMIERATKKGLVIIPYPPAFVATNHEQTK